MAWRFIEPNKPIRASEDFLGDIDSRYIIDAKLDGWRTEIVKRNGELSFLSRANKAHDMPEELVEQFDDLPEGMALDAEWINHTRIKAINSEHNTRLPRVNILVVFDVRWSQHRYIANVPLSKRREIEFYRNLKKTTIDRLLEHDNAVFQAISVNGNNVKQFYSKQKETMISEGIVIKRSDGGLSAPWYKVKYR